MTIDFVCNGRRLRKLDQVIVRCSAPFVRRVNVSELHRELIVILIQFHTYADRTG
jgi:hypothetical protein